MLMLFRRLRYWFRQRQLEAALQEELEFHRALKEQELRQSGLSGEEARFASRRELGNLTRAREDSRAVWIWPWMESVLQDARHAIRGLVTRPSFTVPALAVLVVTMGLATSVYTIVDAVLFRPWPVPQADRVAVVANARRTFPRGDTVYAEYTHLEQQARSLALAAFVQDRRRLAGEAVADGSEVRFVTGSYFDVLRIPIAAGRPLQPADDVRGGASLVAVVSHGLAERQFGGAAAAIGATLRVDDALLTIVGVAAPGARDRPLLPVPEAWLPIASVWRLQPAALRELSQRAFEERLACCLQIVGRLEADVSVRSAESEITLIARQFAAAHGVQPATITLRGTAYVEHPMASEAVNLSALFSAATLLVLLLGCANVGNLLLARAAARRRDVSVRMALGASRMRLIRHLMAESLILSISAALLSVGLASIVVPAVLQGLGPPFEWMLVPVDVRVVLFALALALGVSIASGTLPAFRTTRPPAGGRAIGTTPVRLRTALLGAQVALCVVLVVGAGLLARGLHHATGPGLGFSLDDVTAVRVAFRPGTLTASQYAQVSSRIHDELRSSGLPPVAGTQFAPFTAYRTTRDLRVPPREAAIERLIVRHQVSPEYFEVLRIPVLAGQIFRSSSTSDQVVVNEALARVLWPGTQAVGRTFTDADRDGTRREKRVVGVVADARSQQFHSSQPTYYERGTPISSLLLRGGPADVVRLRDTIQRVAPDASVSDLDPASGLQAQIRLAMTGAAAALAIALLALMLAGVGTLGVVSYLVTERIPEFGVRKALGASNGHVLSDLLAGVWRPLAGGLFIGLIGAQALGSILGANLYGISPRDPLAYLAAFAVLCAAALLALAGPARRALRIDPASMLRAE